MHQAYQHHITRYLLKTPAGSTLLLKKLMRTISGYEASQLGTQALRMPLLLLMRSQLY